MWHRPTPRVAHRSQSQSVATPARKDRSWHSAATRAGRADYGRPPKRRLSRSLGRHLCRMGRISTGIATKVQKPALRLGAILVVQRMPYCRAFPRRTGERNVRPASVLCCSGMAYSFVALWQGASFRQHSEGRPSSLPRSANRRGWQRARMPRGAESHWAALQCVVAAGNRDGSRPIPFDCSRNLLARRRRVDIPSPSKSAGEWHGDPAAASPPLPNV